MSACPPMTIKVTIFCLDACVQVLYEPPVSSPSWVWSCSSWGGCASPQASSTSHGITSSSAPASSSSLQVLREIGKQADLPGDITVKVGEWMEVNIKKKQVRGGKIFVDVWRGRWKWSWPKSQRKLKTILIYWEKREGEHIKQILRRVSVGLDDFMLPLWKIIDI